MTTKFATSAVLLLGLAAASWSQAGNVRSVTTGKLDGGGYQVTVTGDSLTQPTIIRALQGKVYIAEFAANLRTDKGSVKVGASGIDSIQYGWFSARPPKVRIVLRLSDGSINPSAKETKSGWAITVGGVSQASTSVKAAVTVAKSETVNTLETKNGAIVPPALAYPVETHPIPREGSKALLPGAKTAPLNGGQEISVTEVATDVVRETQRAAQKAGTSAKAADDMSAGKRVSLDFVATDILQILKALSIQSSVNIVSAPDVSPTDKPTKLTVSLANVGLDEALSYVTAISGLRYAKVGNTYIVTPRDTFSSAMNSVMERLGKQSETRVVNLISGEAEKIKEATLRAMPQDGRGGYYEIIVPDKHDIPGVVTGEDTGADAAGDGKGQPTKSGATRSSGRVFYLMVVGDADRVAQIDSYIRKLDSKIAETSNLNSQDNKGTAVVPIQSGETGRIKQMIDRLVAEHPRAAEFSVQESILEGATKGEAQTMALLMFGPKDEIGRLEQWARAMDKDICGIIGKPFETENSGLDKVWEVVELDFIEPTILELDLKTRFKGLQVSLMPEGVSPGLKGKTSISEQNSGSTGSGNGQGDGAAKDGGQESSSGSSNEERSITGREPMKIVLRGTQAMVDEAKDYISMVDVSPKQVALELRVMEMTKEDALRVGIDWSALTGGRLRTWRFNQGLGDTSASPGTLTGGNQTTDAQGNPTGTSDTFDFLATLDKIDNGRNLIARPNSLVSDGRSTNLFVGDTVRYIKSIQSTQNGTTVETDEINVGVTFNAGVRIGGNGNIALALNQNFSILTGFTPVPGGGNLPQTSDRTTDMFVNMRSGETLAIGGLILDQDRKRVSGIPILKDLPLIGYLFSRTDNSKVRTEIVFFLTAKVVDASNRKNAASPAVSERKDPDPLGDYKASKGPKGSKPKGSEKPKGEKLPLF